MIPNSISTITAHLNLCLFALFLLSRTSFGIDDPYYQACAPRNCGRLNNTIRYPFYIQGQQEPYCGFPGFGLNCTENGTARIRISENDYIVEEIHYNNQSVRVSNAAVSSNSATGCFPRINNVTLDGNPVFRLGNVSNLLLFSDCRERLSERLMSYANGCNVSGGAGGSSLAMLEGDGNLSLAEEECREKVVAPVELYGGDGSNYGGWNYYRELLRRGFLLDWVASDCSVCDASGGRCGFNLNDLHFICLCRDRPHARRCKSRSRKSLLAVAIGVSLAAVVITVFLLICFRTKCSFYKAVTCLSGITEQQDNVEFMLKNFGPIAAVKFRYSDIKKMTNSFKHTLGQGGFGHVYRGKLCNGKLVAVKVLNGSKGNGEDFINEVNSISRTSHVNIVNLLGFCFEGRKRALVYEFMTNGSLEKFIYDQRFLVDRQLEWETLYQISIGIARGLEYLHRGCNTRILHFDIKPHNILLDENFCPKIADFGLAKLCPGKESILSTMTARGTVGYIAPEVFCRNFGRVSYKSDVYSYGMMALEMVGGRKNIDVGVARTSEIYFPHWIHKQLESNNELGLQSIANEDENEIARKMIIVGLWCVQTDPSTRPSMTRVVEMLEGSLESLQIPPKPYLSSPSRSPTDSLTTEIS